MGLHSGGIDEDLLRRTADLGEGLKQGDPNAPLGPSDIAIVERLPRSIIGRRVDPTSPRFQHMNDAADDPPIIYARLTARVGRKIWRNL
jgi:hypothetical protein